MVILPVILSDSEAQFSYLKHSLLKSQTSENVAHISAILAQLSNISASDNFLFCTLKCAHYFITRPRCSIMYVDVAYCYRPSGMVCWSVYQTVPLFLPLS